MHRMYENEDITIFWDSDKCGHAKRCVGGSPTVFDITKKPWINIEGAPNAEIWQTIQECPSGALTCTYNHGIRIEFDEAGCRSVAFDGDNIIGECDYREDEGSLTIYHTEVSPEYSGKGIAKRLVFKLTEEAERRKKTVIPVCSYAVKVLKD
jgi:uncharacterized Fe-S cluster protein YjdI